MNVKNKYVNFWNNKFVYTEQKSLSDSEIWLSIPVDEKICKKHDFLKNKILSYTDVNGNTHHFALFDVRSSGELGNNKKRIQVPAKYLTNDFYVENLLALGIYDAGNKKCFIRFEKINPFINWSDTSKSVWIKFEYIVYCLKNNKKVKYKTKVKNSNLYYCIYFADNWEDIIVNFNENTFSSVNKEIDEISQEIELFEKENNIEKFILNDDDEEFVFINSLIKENGKEEESVFVDLSSNEKNEKDEWDLPTTKETEETQISTHNPNTDVGRRAEEIFNKILNEKPSFVLDELKIKNIENIDWVNSKKESFKPYDFCVNGYIFIDVKGTSGNQGYFEVSDYEMHFFKEQKEKGNNYFIVNILNVFKEYDENNFKFYDEDELERINFKNKYIYSEER